MPEFMNGLLSHIVYDYPTAIVMFLVVGLSVTGSLALLSLFHRFLPVELRSAHNDVAGFTIAIVGVIYAVLLAFIAISAWEFHGRAQEVVQTEANMVGNLYVDSVGLPPETRFQIWRSLRDYTKTVVEIEWPSQRVGKVNLAGWASLITLNSTLASFKPTDGATIALESDLLRTADELYQARRNRLEAATSGIPAVMWTITLSGGALIIIFSFFFGMPDFRIHLAFTGILSISLALVIVLILALDRPFRGDLAISTERFEEISEGIVPAMKVSLREVTANGSTFSAIKPPELTKKLYSQFFSDLPRETFNSIVVNEN
jgi:Protein of unknown function (DUF4239)